MSAKYSVNPSRLAVAVATALAASHVSAATITVDTLADPGAGGECSLRSAIASVNTQAAVDACYAGDGVNDTIEFAPGLTGQITLSGSSLELTSDVTITGPGAGDLTVDGDQYSRVFHPQGATVSISGLTISGGSADFGAGAYVTDYASLNLADCVLTGNEAVSFGGAIEVFNGVLTVDNCTFSDNYANDHGGALAVTSGYAYINNSILTGNNAYIGGGAQVAPLQSGQGPRGSGVAYLLISDSVVTGNSAVIGGGLGAGYAYGGKLAEQRGGSTAAPSGGPLPQQSNLVVANSDVYSNFADLGGGIGALVDSGYSPEGYYGQTNSIAIDASRVEQNEAYFEGGGVGIYNGQAYITYSEISNNVSGYVGGGIAITSVSGLQPPPPNSASTNNWANGMPQGGPGGDLNILGSIITGNDGGGVSVSGGFLSLFASQVSDNFDADTGGLDCRSSAICQVKYSSVTGNEGVSVGGIRAVGGVGPQGQVGGYSYLGLFSSTVSSNIGGGIGGVYAEYVELRHSTVALNSQSGQGPASMPRGVATGGMLIGSSSTIDNGIVAENTASGAADVAVIGPDTLTLNYSLIGDSTGLTYAGSGNLLDVDPVLGPLDTNGSSYSLTHALLSGSPAIDAGDPAIVSPPDYDQRGPGFDRVIGSQIDMGAFEFGGAPAEPDVGLSTAAIDFSGILVGLNDSAPLTITSTGTDDLILGQIGFAPRGGVFGIANDNCSGQTLIPGGDCTLDITFQPPGRGNFNDLLSIPSNAPDSPAEVALAGVGIAPELAISAPAINFGNVTIGDSVDDSVVLTNVGDADLDLTGSDVAAPFSVVAGAGLCLDGGTTTLAPTEACTLTFRFEPVVEGPAGQTVNVASNSLGGDSTVGLSGTGFTGAPPVDPAIPVPIMSRVGTMVLAGGLLMLGLFGLRRRIG